LSDWPVREGNEIPLSIVTAVMALVTDDAADDVAIVHPSFARAVPRQQGLDCRPLLIAQPKFTCHDPNSAVFKLESRKLKPINSLIGFGT
jgi:hypothetical protein